MEGLKINPSIEVKNIIVIIHKTYARPRLIPTYVARCKKIKLLVISKVYKTNNAPGIQAMPQ